MTEQKPPDSPYAQRVESVVVWGWLILFWISVAALAVNIPYYDEWFHLRWALRILDAGAAGAGPFEWVNGSRLVLFRSLLLGELRVFGAYTPVLFMALSTVCCTLSALVGVTLLRRTLAPSWLRTLASSTVVLLAASLAQHEVLLWGIEVSMAVPVALAAIGVLAIPRVSDHLRVRLALMLSLLGLLSFATGVAVFVALGFAVWRADASRRALLIFGVVSLGVLIVWHADMNTASTGANVAAAHLTIVEKLWRIPAHFLAALGSATTASVLWPVARKGGASLTLLIDIAAVLAGLAPLIVFGRELLRRKTGDNAQERLTTAAWTLFVFGACAALFIAYGRHDQGISQALSSRYVTLTVLAPVGAALILARDGRRWFLGVFAAAALANAAAGIVVAYAFREARVEGAASVPFVQEFPELPGFEALTPDFPRNVAVELMRRNMIAPEAAPAGVRTLLEQVHRTDAPPCVLTPPGALTATYRKPTPAIASFPIETPMAGSLVVLGRSADAIHGLSAERIGAAGKRVAQTTLKGAPPGPIDLEAWIVTGATLDTLAPAGACHTVIAP